MGKTKKRRPNEVYEDYWKFTAAFTDIYGIKFNHCLNVIVNYIDEHHDALIANADGSGDFASSNLYKNLQALIVQMMDYKGSDGALSARKAINLYVKIGFVKPFLVGYHPLVKKFILAKDEQKRIIYSKIFYESSSLASGATEDNTNLHHVSFFLQTLDYNKCLTNRDLTALMVTDITKYEKGYLTRKELDDQYRYVVVNRFEDRKYNQIAHFVAFLKHFVDLKYNKEQGKFWFVDDPDIVDEEFDRSYPRDNIKHRIYKNELKAESHNVYGQPVCFFYKKPYKVLIASHIKPCQTCLREGKEDEAYDPNNGLLLNQVVDSYFDKFEISFSDDGSILIGKTVSDEIRIEFEKYRLDAEILNDSRKRYLAYHRALFEAKNGR